MSQFGGIKKQNPRAQGGPVVLSSDTQRLLDDLMGQSKLSTRQQRNLRKKLNNNGVLPTSILEERVVADAKPSQPKPSLGKGKKTHQAILEETADYLDCIPQRPADMNSGVNRQAEVTKLQTVMSGVDHTVTVEKQKTKTRNPPPKGIGAGVTYTTTDDAQLHKALLTEFGRIQEDIKQRQQFLKDMQGLGKSDAEYERVVNLQIQQKIKDMHRIDQLLKEYE